jgi:hypothetical protein
MPEVVADRFHRQTLLQQVCGTGMAERVGSVMSLRTFRPSLA